jgi:hypothetical protein
MDATSGGYDFSMVGYRFRFEGWRPQGDTERVSTMVASLLKLHLRGMALPGQLLGIQYYGSEK